VIVNRVHPSFGTEAVRPKHNSPLEPLRLVLEQSQAVAREQDDVLSTLTDALPAGTVVKIPFLDTDVHDLDGLASLAQWLTPAGNATSS
jgi:hypothetical protein